MASEAREWIAWPELVALGKPFADGLTSACSGTVVDPVDLATIIHEESGFSPCARNPQGGATGLLQWMPSVAPSVGTTTDALYMMTAAQQLPYVAKSVQKMSALLGPYANFWTGYAPLRDLALANFWPAAVGKDDAYVIFRQGTKGYEQNPIPKQDPTVLTAGDVTRYIDGHRDAGIRKYGTWDGQSAPTKADVACGGNAGRPLWPLVLVLAGVAGLALWAGGSNRG